MVKAKKYVINWYYGDYKHRQHNANEDGIDFYIEHHLNCHTKNSNYTLCKILNNQDEIPRNFSSIYTKMINKLLGIPLYIGKDIEGIVPVSVGQQGFHNISLTKMPSVLVEPIFVSNSSHVEKFFNGGREVLALCLAESIKQIFPDGAKIGFSVGHKYKRIEPFDRGSCAWGKPEFTESDLSEQVLFTAKFILEHNIVPVELQDLNINL